MITPELIKETIHKLFPNFTYRPNQYEVIERALIALLVEDKKFVVVSSPVGSGKSWIGYQIANVYNHLTSIENPETLFLTKTISLQNQYTEDFPRLALLKGADNYECSVDYPVPILPKFKHHNSCLYDKRSPECGCSYNLAKEIYVKSPLKLLNYAFYLTGIDRYQTHGLVVCDEAHNFEESILNMLGMDLDLLSLRDLCYRSIGEDLALRFPYPLESINKLDHSQIEILGNFSSMCMTRINQEIDDLESQLEDESIEVTKLIKVIETKLDPLKAAANRLAYYGLRLSVMSSSNLDFFSIHYQDKKEDVSPYFEIKPVFIPEIVNSLIFGMPDKFVFMSATANRIVDSLKLPKEDVELITTPYIFDLANRPFYALNGLKPLNMASYDEVFPLYCGVTDSIISQYPEDTNVIIHSVSYKNAELYKENSAFKDRIFIPTSEQVRDLKQYIEKGMIVVSPSITEGVDLGEGLGRVQIFMKCPYPYLGDLWVKKKMEFDEGWYGYATMLAIIQGSGRGVRSPTDRADTFILDPSFKRLYYKTLDYLPDWFDKSIQWVDM